MSTAVTHNKAKLAALSRSRVADDPELIQARLDLRAEVLAAHVQKALADAPDLSESQRMRIARLLLQPTTAGAR